MFWRALFEKKEHLKNFSRKCWRRGGAGHLKKNFPDIPKKLSGYTTFFPTGIPKNYPEIWYFSRKRKKFSGNNIDSSFQKCPLGKKCNLNDIFHARKGHFAPEKGHLAKLGGGGLAPPVPTPLQVGCSVLKVFVSAWSARYYAIELWVCVCVCSCVKP
jgi:hypothetical protein